MQDHDPVGRRELIMSLAVIPGRGRAMSPEEFLRRAGAADGRQLGLDLLRDAVQRQHAVDLEMALIVCFTFGFTMDHLDLLLQMSSADWHRKHEDIVSALAELRSSTAVSVLVRATQWVPEYLEFDETRALARRAIWALGKTPGPEAARALGLFLHSDNEIFRKTARTALEYRTSAGWGAPGD
jgi:hypothetical protein